MSRWNLLFRRVHLYLGLLLLPWVTMYAVSTWFFNHAGVSRHGHAPAADDQWVPLWEKEYAIDLPAGQEGLRATAGKILADNRLEARYGVQRQGQRLTVNLPNFRQPMRLVYEADRRKLRAEQRKFSWSEALQRMHVRTGYGQPGLLHNLWAVMVDVFSATTLLWVATGIYLWWKLPATRRWGFFALGGGFASIALLLATL